MSVGGGGRRQTKGVHSLSYLHLLLDTSAALIPRSSPLALSLTSLSTAQSLFSLPPSLLDCSAQGSGPPPPLSICENYQYLDGFPVSSPAPVTLPNPHFRLIFPLNPSNSTRLHRAPHVPPPRPLPTVTEAARIGLSASTLNPPTACSQPSSQSNHFTCHPASVPPFSLQKCRGRRSLLTEGSDQPNPECGELHLEAPRGLQYIKGAGVVRLKGQSGRQMQQTHSAFPS